MFKYMNKFIAYLTIPLAVIVVYCALMRYVFHAMPDWGFEAAIFIFGVQATLGGVHTHEKRKHVTVDIIQKFLSERANLRLLMVYEFVIVFVCAVLLYVSLPWAWDSFLIGERSMHQTVFNPPIWWFKALVPLTSVMMTTQALLNFKELMRNLGELKRRQVA